MQHRLQLGDPNGKTLHRNRLDPCISQRVPHKPVAQIVAIQGNIGNSGKFGLESRARRDPLRRMRIFFTRHWRSADAERLDETPRSCATVRIIDSHGVTWKREVGHAHRLFYLFPETRFVPDLRTIVSNRSPASRCANANRIPLKTNMLGIETVCLSLQVFSIDAALRTQLDAC